MKSPTQKNGTIQEIVINAKGKRLGRLASEVAHLLMGKQYPSFKRHILKNVKVTVVDAGKLDVSSRKMVQKYYVRYSGYPGGIAEERMKEVIAKKGMNELVKRAVYGMLPANKLRTPRMKNLKII
ncbi:50S ribosomal protein L13 [Candidatus Uhrbacteria bacterium]|nr:50S ribosomal protein L13 [Candidatus Uhrbacteria bacterium]